MVESSACRGVTPALSARCSIRPLVPDGSRGSCGGAPSFSSSVRPVVLRLLGSLLLFALQDRFVAVGYNCCDSAEPTIVHSTNTFRRLKAAETDTELWVGTDYQPKLTSI